MSTTTTTFTTTATKMALASPTRRTSIPITTTSSMTTDHHAAPCCPKCGYDLHVALALDAPLDSAQIALLDAQRQIEDLQAQVRLLNQKASAAVDRWADYEDELAKLRETVDRQQMQQGQALGSAANGGERDTSPTRSSFLPAGAATRLSALLGPRKSTPNLKTLPPVPSPQQHYQHQPPQRGHMSRLSQPSNNSSNSSSNSLSNYLPMTPRSPFGPGLMSSSSNPSLLGLPHQGGPPSPTGSSLSTDDLLSALSREQAARVAAEGRLTETSREVEELSVSLFEQANEMVATERRARARLEERVETLERRDAEKRRRLDRLESAVGRIERVKALLGETKTPVAAAAPMATRVA